MKIVKRAAPVLGPEGLIELRQLLQNLLLTDTHSPLQRGQSIDVLVSVWPAREGADCFDVLVSVFEPGGERVPLVGLRIWARGQDASGLVLRTGECTPRGDISIKGLWKGLTYRLHLPQIGAGESEAEVPLPIQQGYAAAPAAGLAPVEATDLPRYNSSDGKVRVTMQVREEEDVVIGFETRESGLAGAAVQFHLVNNIGRVEHGSEVRLAPARGGRWEGRWKGPLRLARPCRLMFEVVRDSNDPLARDSLPAVLPPEIVRAIQPRPAEPETDPVDCTVYAPPKVPPGSSLFVQVFAHRAEQADQAGTLAREFDETTQRRGFRSLAMDVVRNTRLTFHLALPGLEVADPIQELTWRGRPEAVQFVVGVPGEFKPGVVAGTVWVSQEGVPLGHVKFLLTISAEPPAPAGPLGEQAHRYRKVFISYATKDRDEVLKRVQMLDRMKVPYFQDVLSLDPGVRWERELYRHIDECDLFLLFWSRAARDSEWVLKEVRHALARKGSDELALPEIMPVILEGPPPVEPPDDLKRFHFNDRVLYFLGLGAQQRDAR